MSREKIAEMVEVSGDIVNATPCKIDLHNSTAIRREVSSVYRDMRAGRIETQDGTRLAYVLDMIRKAYESAVLEERIAALENNVKENER